MLLLLVISRPDCKLLEAEDRVFSVLSLNPMYNPVSKSTVDTQRMLINGSV